MQVGSAAFPTSAYVKWTWDSPIIPLDVRLNNLAGDFKCDLNAPLDALGFVAKFNIRNHMRLSRAWTIDIVLPNGTLLGDDDALGRGLFGPVPYFFAVPKHICGTPQDAIDAYEFNPCRLSV